MRLATLGVLLVPGTATLLPPPQSLLTNPIDPSWDIPSIHESAIQARRILRLETIGTLSTIFPSSSSSSSNEDVTPAERRPADVRGTPIGLMDYYADCESHGNPTILAIGIATSFKNAAAGSNITLSLRWHPPSHVAYGAAGLPRYSLVGYLEDISDEEARKGKVEECFVKKHPDAVAWLPGNRIHESRWVRLVVHEVYWIGGFGDRAYIGWIPREEWFGVSEEEIEGVRLPGEKRRWKWPSIGGDW